MEEEPIDFANLTGYPRTSEESADIWAVRFIAMYGQIDGSHHKAWVLDQVARILMGTKVRECIHGTHPNQYIAFETAEPSAEYLEWVESMKDGGEFEYEEGIAP